MTSLIYGLPMSGKTTLIKTLKSLAHDSGKTISILDTDDLLNKELSRYHSISAKLDVLEYICKNYFKYDYIFTNFQFYDEEIDKLLIAGISNFRMLPLPEYAVFCKEWSKCRDIPVSVAKEWYYYTTKYVNTMAKRFTILTANDIIRLLSSMLYNKK